MTPLSVARIAAASITGAFTLAGAWMLYAPDPAPPAPGQVAARLLSAEQLSGCLSRSMPVRRSGQAIVAALPGPDDRRTAVTLSVHDSAQDAASVAGRAHTGAAAQHNVLVDQAAQLTERQRAVIAQCVNA